MKKLLLTLAALPAATMAVEASAQTNMYSDGAMGIQTRIANLEARLNAGAQARVFTQQEYANLSSQLRNLRNLERQYSANGLTTAERRQLQNRIRVLRDDLRMAGGNGWANRYGWTDRDLEMGAYGNAYGSDYGNGYGNAYGNAYGNSNVRTDQYGRPVDQYGRVIATTGYRTDQYGRTIDQYGRVVSNGSVTYDQYGRPVSNGGYHGQGGPYEPVYTPRSSNGGIGNVLGGVLGSVVGGGSGVGGVLGGLLGGRSLGIGDVITGAIANVLRGGSSYGNQYRDNGSTYFRSDGERVYEIDARTNQVVRIHPIR
ncbi:MAG TPA: hypothetical protein VEZ41_05740 [Allosphingosinicella sp.]|jgi:hypothetical protein|nr:hypothetical protein [Allosphingosinicella sp.]